MSNYLISNMLPLSFCLILVIIFFPSSSNGAYDVIKLGAKPDGRTDSTKSFLRAWDLACKSIKPMTMYVPRGRYLIKRAVFSGPCRNRMIVRMEGTLVAPNNYNVLATGNSRNWILFDSINRLSIFGGTLDGRASRLWACKLAHKSCPQGAMSLTFNNARNVVLSGLTSKNSQGSHLAINGCKKMVIRRITLIAPDQSPNTDGIDIQSSTDVTITDSTIKTGDDCIAIGPGTNKVLIERVRCGPGHGISIGSLARAYNEQGVQNVRVKDVVFTGSDNGLRIKSWARPSNGFVREVFYQNITMNNVRNPIVIDQRYCPGNNGCPNQHSGIKISGVTYRDIRGTSATEVAIKFHCSATSPCDGIKLHNVKLTHFNKPAQSFCLNAAGSTTGVVFPGSCL